MALVTPIPSVRVLWRPEQFNRVSNPGFESNTSGWSASAGINAAGSAISRSTSNVISGTASGQVDCTTTDGSGVNFDFGSDRFYREADYGAIYVAVVWMKRISGSTRARIILGSEGTAADRATLTITDLVDAPRAYVVRWLPTANRTDVQLAITNGSAEELTVNIDDVAVYQVDAFSQVENGTFEVDTTGWSVSAGNFAAAATSITRTAGGFGGSYCGRLVTTASASSGVTFDLGGRKFTSGRTYRARIGVKTVSGNTGFTLHLGSPTSSDSATASVTAPAGWAWFTVDWTPAADRTNAEVAIYSSGTSVRTVDVDELEVYEAHDDLGTDAGDLTWERSHEGIGTITVKVKNTDGKYDPRNSSGALYGSVAPGKRIWGRATYSNALYPLLFGSLVTVEPNPYTPHADIVAEDMMGPLSRATCYVDFDQTDTYAYARYAALNSFLTGDRDTNTADASIAHYDPSDAGGLELNTFYAGTDGDVGILDFLADLNEATQSVHWIEPSVHANIGWMYRVVDRATLTDTSSDFTVDESDPPTAFEGVRLTHEALENRQEVPWQAYEVLPPPGADDEGWGAVMLAYDPDVYVPLGSGSEAPYLIYTDDEYGTSDAHPEPRWRYPGGNRRRWRQRKRRGLSVKNRTRVYPGAFIPTTFAAGEVRTYVLDFAIPISGPTVTIDGSTGATNIIVDYIEQRPNRLVVTLRAIAEDDLDLFGVYGTPWLPLDELDEQVESYASQGAYGVHAGPSFSTPYIPSLGAAQGVGAYRNWRYGDPRLRPTIVDRNNFPRTLTADLTDHYTVTLGRWHISSVLFAVTSCRWSVTSGGLDWVATHNLEELPDHTDWFILDDGSAGLDDAVVLAY